MVVFTCSACGDSVKKNQVEKHYLTKCRRCEMLTCVDCHKDFWGDEYKSHVKCVTEAERYGVKGNQPVVFKGDMKQREVADMVASLVDKPDITPRVRSVLQSMLPFDNIPRKMKPFKNFLKSSLRMWNDQLADEVWQVIERVRKERESQQQKRPPENGTQQNKRLCENGASTKETAAQPRPNFKWKKAVKETLRAADGQQLSRRKLKKKVFSLYRASGVESPMTEEEMEAKFQRTITTNNRFKEEGDVVRLAPLGQ